MVHENIPKTSNRELTQRFAGSNVLSSKSILELTGERVGGPSVVAACLAVLLLVVWALAAPAVLVHRPVAGLAAVLAEVAHASQWESPSPDLVDALEAAAAKAKVRAVAAAVRRWAKGEKEEVAQMHKAMWQAAVAELLDEEGEEGHRVFVSGYSGERCAKDASSRRPGT